MGEYWYQMLMTQITDTIWPIVLTAIGAVSTWVGVRLSSYLGQAASDRLTAIFQTAAQSAAAWLIAQVGIDVALKMKPDDPMLKKAVKTQVKDSIPGTLDKLGNPPDHLIGDKILAWVSKIAMGAISGGGTPPKVK